MALVNMKGVLLGGKLDNLLQKMTNDMVRKWENYLMALDVTLTRKTVLKLKPKMGCMTCVLSQARRGQCLIQCRV